MDSVMLTDHAQMPFLSSNNKAITVGASYLLGGIILSPHVNEKTEALRG